MPDSPSRDPRADPPDSEEEHYNYQEMLEHLRRVRSSTQEQGLKSKKKRRRRTHQPIHTRRRRRIIAALAFLLIGLPAITFIGGSYLFSYLHYETEIFRKEISQKTSQWLGVEGQFEDKFAVSRLKFSTPNFQGVSADRSRLLAEVSMENIEAFARLRSLLDNRWSLTLLRCDEGMLRFRSVTPGSAQQADVPRVPLILRAGLGFQGVPRDVTVDRFAANSLSVFFGAAGDNSQHLTEAHVSARLTDKGYLIECDRGFLQYKHWPKFVAQNVKALLDSSGRLEFIPTEKALRVAEGGDSPGICNLSGHFALDANPTMNVVANMEGVKVEDTVRHTAWGGRLMGQLRAKLEFTGGLTMGSSSEMTGELEIDGLAIKNLDFLSSLEEFCGISALKRIEFDKFSAKIKRSGGEIHLHDIYGRNTSNLGVMGSITIHADGMLDGDLEIGLPDKIWSEKNRLSRSGRPTIGERPSFFEPRGEDFSWAKVKVSGTLDSPQDDLIPRFQSLVLGTSKMQVRTDTFRRPGIPEQGRKSDYQRMLERMFETLSK